MATQPNDGSRRVTAQVQETAEELMERAGETARSRIDDGKQQAARELNSVAHALRNCGTDLESDRTALLAPYVNRVADQVERFSRYIDTHSPQDIARNVEGFARRNPAVFLGGCFALGMVAARFLKSSRSDLPVPMDYYRSAELAGYTPQTARPTYDGEGSSYSEPLSGGDNARGYEYGHGRARND
jgi:hypothetical protein